ncbi:FAD binding domain-containing protein [Nonomuraea longicatena]|uniref:Xanthine dehydrogenase family protein subunit M n=1 Tax=Nonomuraea longicatena TaxID=83682 RepID=A0ABP3Z164_9ACTN
MKPAPFDYRAPREVEEALHDLAAADSKVLAGGQSLIPLLNMRLAAPKRLVDINRITGLDTVAADREGVTIGALARHSAVLADPAVAAAQPLIGRALRLVAHPVIRNRGTVVGSLVHADPAAELPAVLAVLSGSVRLASAGGVREVPAAAFFAGPLESDLRPGELAVSARFPARPRRTGSAFHEVARRHGDYALAGVCAVVTLGDDLRVHLARTACVGVGPVPVVTDVTGPCADGDWAAAAAEIARAAEPEPDIHASAEYRTHLVRVLAERALREAAREAGQEGG